MIKKCIMKLLAMALVLAMLPLPTAVLAAEGAEGTPVPQAEEKTYKMWYKTPAKQDLSGFLTEALHIGNGYMGVSVFGGTDTELLAINENSLFNPYISNSGTSKVMYAPSGEERPNSNEGGLNLLSKTYLDFGHGEVTNYTRYLSLNDAIAGVSYDHNGVTYTREYFSTYPDKVTVLHLTASQEGALTFTLRPEAVFTNDYLMTPGDGYSKSGAATVSGDTVTVKGTMDYFGINYEGLFKVIPEGGTLAANEENATVTVTGANSATVLIAVGTNYEMTSEVFTKSDATKLDRTADPHGKVQGYLDAAAVKSYEALRQAHIDDYREFFDRAQIDLGGVFSDTVPTNELVTAYKNGTWNPYIEELMFQFGRYMLIASSREGCLPSNLQGIWNFCDSSAWSSGYWHNINVQMNYWPAFNTDMAELFQSYVDYNEAFRKQAQANADSYLKTIKAPNMAAAGTGGNGWAVGTGCNPYRCSAPSAGGHSGPGTGAFTSLLFWDYYDFTRDEDILRNHTYPAVEGMAQFLSQTLVEQPDGKWLVGNSASPENISGKDPETGKQDYIRTVGSAFDQQMVYENHLVTQKAAQILGYTAADHPILATIEEQIDHLDPVNIGWSGQIKEYREENYYGDLGEWAHRHISQLVGLYPGTSINGTTDAWQDAAVVSLTNRGDGSTGWATAHRQLAWARLQDGENAYRLLSKLITARVNSSMWLSYSSAKNSPFQIESHFGYTTGMAEMLVQSHAGYVEFLPALPETWATGSFTGLTTRGNFSVDAQWENGQATRLVLRSRAGSDCSVKYPGIANATIVDSKGNAVSVTKEGNDLISFPTVKGESYTVTGLAAKGKVSAPGTLTLKPDGSKIQLSWGASADAASYNVYRAVNDEGAYTAVATGITGTTYSYDPVDLKGTDRLTLRVTAVGSNGQESKGSLAYSLPLEAPGQVVGTMFGTDLQLQILGEEAEGYRVYENGVLKLETTLPIAVVSNASTAKTYSVSVVSNGRESAATEVVMTVCTPTDNVMLGRTLVLEGRSGWNSNYPGTCAVDGDTTIPTSWRDYGRWAVSESKDPFSVTADLQGIYKLGTMKIYQWNSGTEATRSDNTKVEVQTPEGEWVTVKEGFSLITKGSTAVDMGEVVAKQVRITFENTVAAKSACIAEITCTGLEIQAVNKVALYKALESYGDESTAKPTVPVAYITARRAAMAALTDTEATQKTVDQATLDLINAMTKANIFLNTAVTTDAVNITTYYPYKLVDGDSGTRFAMSGGSANKESVTFTIPLDGSYHLEAVFIQEFLDSTTLSRAKNVILEAYYDGTWTTVFTGKTLTDTRDPSTGTEVNRCGSNAFVLDQSVKASQVRFTFEHKNTSGLMTIFELQGYGQKIEGLNLSASRLTLTSGKTHQLTGSAAGTWTTSDASVVTVDSTGKLTAQDAGSATVTLTDANGNKAQCLVTVELDLTELNTKLQQAQATLDAYLPIDGTPDQVIAGVAYAPKAEYNALQSAADAAREVMDLLSDKDQADALVKQLTDAIAAVEAKAATGTMADSHSHCTCGGTLDHTHSAVNWTAWGDSREELTSVPLTAGNYYLVADIEIPKEPVLPAGVTVNLCLNGHDLTNPTDQAYSVTGTLNICDCTDAPGTVTGGATNQGAAIFVINKGTVNIYGGIFHGAGKAEQGGVLYVASGGKAYLYGGVIENGTTTSYGGNVYVVSGGYLELDGGTVRNGTSDAGASNIHCGGNVTVLSGTVSGAKKVNSIIVTGSCNFQMKGGLLAGSSVRNVSVWDSGTFAMTGGEMTAGACGSDGANLRADKGAHISVTGGKITGAPVSDIHMELVAAKDGAVNPKNAPDLTIRNATVDTVYIADNHLDYDPVVTFGGNVVIGKVLRGGTTKPIVNFETLGSGSSVTFYDETAGTVFGKGSSTDYISSNNNLVAVLDGENLMWQNATFRVTFLNEDDSVISEKDYAYGATVQIPADPTKAADNTYTYAFSGWDKAVEATCKGDATYKATFKGTYIDYTVKFLNEDGTPISEKTYHYGDQIEIPADPTKAADNTFTYAFNGWSPKVSATCAGNATYQATFAKTNISYTVKFLNEDGTPISEKTYHYGDQIEIPADPTKAADNTYTYAFNGWDKAVDATCKGNATYQATFKATYIDYTVKFLNEDGTPISENTYHYGDAITVPAPADPTKAADNTYTYAFNGWDKAVDATCKGDATYKATFKGTYIDYTVKFLNEDGTPISEKSYHYGDAITVPADPTKAADNTYTYTFSGWDKAVEATCKGDATYKATFKETYIDYTVKFLNEDGTPISEKTYHYGDQIEIPADPTKAADSTFTYAFNGWSPKVSATCAGNATYQATFAKTNISYTVKFLNEDGTPISEKTYHYGDQIDIPADPTKAADNTYTYAFNGWDKAVEATCKGNATYQATFKETYIDYTVKFLNEDGTPISEKTYHYGDAITVPADPTKAADNTYTYAFSGWDKAVEATCKGNATYQATFREIYIDYTVKFLNEDGTPISEKTYHYGDQIEVPADPTKAADNTYTYTFGGWDKAVEATCKGNATYQASFKATYIDYTVKFLNEDGTPISGKSYHYGDQIEVPADPTKAADNTYTYAFNGWDKAVEATCKGDASYKATFKGTYIDYTVKFLNEDGTPISEKTYHYGDAITVPADPTKAADNTYTYAFSGWDKAVDATCKGNATYQATFKATYIDYTVKFLNEDGTPISEKIYHYGDQIEIPADPVKANFRFEGWEPAVAQTVTADATYTAKWTRLTTPVVPGDSVSYVVEHYKAGTDGKYPATPTETQLLQGKIGDTVTAEAKAYAGFCLNSQSSVTSGKLVALANDANILVLKLYYDADANSDKIPDRFQKKVTFRITNGTWSDGTDKPVTVWLTLTRDGKWDESGATALTVPTGMKPAEGCEDGKWNVQLPETVTGSEALELTYSFVKPVPQPSTPSTGDEAPIGTYVLLLAASLLAAAAVLTVMKKKSAR